jgi:hypothetical protein
VIMDLPSFEESRSYSFELDRSVVNAYVHEGGDIPPWPHSQSADSKVDLSSHQSPYTSDWPV